MYINTQVLFQEALLQKQQPKLDVDVLPSQINSYRQSKWYKRFTWGVTSSLPCSRSPHRDPGQSGRTDCPVQDMALLGSYLNKFRWKRKPGKHRTVQLMHRQQLDSLKSISLSFYILHNEFFLNKTQEDFGVTQNKDSLFVPPAWR